MHSLPPWYVILTEFSYISHTIIDILFIIVGFAIVIVVSRPSWRQHLRWANPAAGSSVLSGIDRMSRDLHHYFHVGTAVNSYLTSELFNYGANFLALYSTFVLWQMLRDLARNPVSPNPLAEQPSQAGVWPPAPIVR
ncbi:MAG: hypothetical protein ACRYFS_13980 [Janthinobacterium lividum]